MGMDEPKQESGRYDPVSASAPFQHSKCLKILDSRRMWLQTWPIITAP
jgi:hypothetical protein